VQLQNPILLCLACGDRPTHRLHARDVGVEPAHELIVPSNERVVIIEQLLMSPDKVAVSVEAVMG
jgi:hypothetical protein